MPKAGTNTPGLSTTKEAAKSLGIAPSTLRGILQRYGELRPATKIGSGDWLWNLEEIQRLRLHRATHRGGRQRKKPAQ